MSAAAGRAAAVVALALVAVVAFAQSRTTPRVLERPRIEHAVLGEPGRAPEVTTAELREILTGRQALVLDVRPYAEYALGHIPGAQSPFEPRETAATTPAATRVRALLGNRRDGALILHGNGPAADLRLADSLFAAGFTGVRRYALGVAVWRALGGVTEVEDQGLRRVGERDRDAVLVDGRDSIHYAARTIPGAINIPRVQLLAVRDSGDVSSLRLSGSWPAYDHDARILVFGADSSEARSVAEMLARQAFRNVSFYGGTFLDALVASGR